MKKQNPVVKETTHSGYENINSRPSKVIAENINSAQNQQQQQK